MHAFTASLNQG